MLFSHNKRVLIYGDVMIDQYWYGDANRISPESPVPVVNINTVDMRLGGAANVAHNVSSLGIPVTLFGLVGNDTAAAEIKALLTKANIDFHFLELPNYPTITKLRVLANRQQLIRIDFEKTQEEEIADDSIFLTYCKQLKSADIVILSDYSKSALCHVERLIAAAKENNLPVIVDPKHKNYERYSGATLLTPNLKEFEAVVGKCANFLEIESKAKNLMNKIKVESLLVTMGKDGMIYITPEKPAVHFSAQAKDVFDVTGAGDTVVAVIAAAIASGIDILKAIELSNLAASVVVSRSGVHPINIFDLQKLIWETGDLSAGILTEQQLLTLVAQAKASGEKIIMTNGCFDILHIGHIDYLARAKKLGDRLIVAVNDDNSVRRLKGADRPINTLNRRMGVLSALNSVDWVVPFSEDTPARIISTIKPDVLVKGGDYTIDQIVGAKTVINNGGTVKTFPLVEDFSTTKLIDKILNSKK